MPKQDILRDTCCFLDSKAARKRFQNFTKNRNDNALNMAVRSIHNEKDGILSMVYIIQNYSMETKLFKIKVHFKRCKTFPGDFHL